MSSANPTATTDLALPVQDGRLVCLEVRTGHLSALQEVLAGLPVGHGRRLYVLDGANRFDCYAFSVIGRRLGCDRILADVFVSRAFTIHQLEAAAERLLPPLLLSSPLPLVIVLGIEYLFLEESLPMWERQHVLRSVLATLRGLREQGLPVLATYEPEPHAWWFPVLREAGDSVGRLDAVGDVPKLTWVR